MSEEGWRAKERQEEADLITPKLPTWAPPKKEVLVTAPSPGQGRHHLYGQTQPREEPLLSLKIQVSQEGFLGHLLTIAPQGPQHTKKATSSSPPWPSGGQESKMCPGQGRPWPGEILGPTQKVENEVSARIETFGRRMVLSVVGTSSHKNVWSGLVLVMSSPSCTMCSLPNPPPHSLAQDRTDTPISPPFYSLTQSLYCVASP